MTHDIDIDVIIPLFTLIGWASGRSSDHGSYWSNQVLSPSRDPYLCEDKCMYICPCSIKAMLLLVDCKDRILLSSSYSLLRSRSNGNKKSEIVSTNQPCVCVCALVTPTPSLDIAVTRWIHTCHRVRRCW